MVIHGTGAKPKKPRVWLAMDSSDLRPSTEFRIDPANITFQATPKSKLCRDAETYPINL